MSRKPHNGLRVELIRAGLYLADQRAKCRCLSPLSAERLAEMEGRRFEAEALCLDPDYSLAIRHELGEAVAEVRRLREALFAEGGLHHLLSSPGGMDPYEVVNEARRMVAALEPPRELADELTEREAREQDQLEPPR